ncbi:MAG: sugar transferase [Gammaproteobacteria bacterium]|nr:sugar transferase [Gammaproteobacteria bacterium]
MNNDPLIDSPSRKAESIPVEIRGSLAANDPATLPPIVGLNAAVKRLFDFSVGSIAVLLLIPLFIVVSIAIKLGSTGPALFYQQRRGRNGEFIAVYKFRTMYQNYSTPLPTASSFIQTRKDDPRVTRIGAFLRKTSLDELPQLINVIQGSMSLVGPRPHPMPLDDQYKHIIPALDSRYIVKPGLTGWAQVNGFRGETARLEDMVARVEHDRYYIKHWTLWLDIKIIAITAFKGWTHRNAY